MSRLIEVRTGRGERRAPPPRVENRGFDPKQVHHETEWLECDP
jgi:hypothetical protein